MWATIRQKLLLIISLVVITFLGPKVFSGTFPRLTAYFEALTNIDLSGRGRCRMDNTQAILKMGSGKLVSGFVKSANGSFYGHLWGVAPNGEIIDCVCPESNTACKDRTAVAEYDPFTSGVPVTKMAATNAMEGAWASWGKSYLTTYIPLVSRKGTR